MRSDTFTLFTDTGGIILLDPAHADALADEFAEQLNAVLDPEGAAEQASAQNVDWPRARAEAASALRRMSAGGEFTLVLSGEGTFHVRVQSEDLGAEERGRVVESFEERLRVTSGRLAFTDGMEFFDDELDAESAVVGGIPEGWYAVHIHHLRRHPSLTPTVGVHGSEEHPALVVQLGPAQASEAAARDGEAFPRLKTSQQGYDEPRPGWDCYAQVTGVEGGAATLELMLTETVYAGHARMSVPEGEELEAGDYVLVRLVEDAGDHWTAEWQD
ncbi:MAG TPA: hypothetical protein VEQ42_05755 [Pyrinomonadaceae bacterium]|nr:hypothetical protein [Pyrinomonadaceae bacterium]